VAWVIMSGVFSLSSSTSSLSWFFSDVLFSQRWSNGCRRSQVSSRKLNNKEANMDQEMVDDPGESLPESSADYETRHGHDSPTSSRA
jgi:hypothetical protein